ncbi:MAG: YhjD/YihY/BrkB family envelope integrity protein [Phycisphaerales bacterium]
MGNLRALWQFVRVVLANAHRVQIARMAAALSYRTIFGLIPVIVISLIVLRAFSTPDELKLKVRQIMDFTGLSQVTLTQEQLDQSGMENGVTVGDPRDAAFENPDSTTDPAGSPAAPAATGHTPSPTNATSHQFTSLDQWIEEVVDNVHNVKVSAIGTVGAIMLMYAAISMLVEIEKAYNQVFLAPIGRSWPRRIMLYWTLLTLGSVCLVLTFYLQERTLLYLRGNDGLLGRWLGFLGSYPLTVMISALMLTLMYMAVPNSRVQVGPAFVGAFVAALGLEGAKRGFSMYVAYSSSTARLYGLLALIPLFLIWIYVTWLINIGGLIVTHSLQSYTAARKSGALRDLLGTLGLVPDSGPGRHPIVDTSAVLALMVVVTRRFATGKPTDRTHIANELGLDEDIAAVVMEQLAARKMLLSVAGKTEGGYTLARPPESISASEVLRLGEELSSVDVARVAEVMDELRAHRAKVLAGRTLADLIAPRPAGEASLSPQVPSPA